MTKLYSISEFANRINKSTSTLRRWDNNGVLIAKRTPGGHRYYDQSHLRKILGIDVPETKKKTIVYCRVSSRGQKNDLVSQKSAMESFCLGAGIPVDEWIEEFGSGMNFKRKQFLSIIDQIEVGEVKTIVIAHKDRFIRFGFEFFERFATEHGAEFVIANQEKLSPQQEMVEDLMAVIHVFSCRLYGLKRYKKKIKQAVSESNENSF